MAAAPTTPAPRPRPAAGAPSAPAPARPLMRDYRYVGPDLLRIAVTAAIVIAGLVAAALVLR